MHCAERHGRGRCVCKEDAIHLCESFATLLKTFARDMPRDNVPGATR